MTRAQPGARNSRNCHVESGIAAARQYREPQARVAAVDLELAGIASAPRPHRRRARSANSPALSNMKLMRAQSTPARPGADGLEIGLLQRPELQEAPWLLRVRQRNCAQLRAAEK